MATRKAEIESLDDLGPENAAPKSFRALLAEGLPHKGGLAQLASLEEAGLLPSTEPPTRRSGRKTSTRPG